MWISDRHNLNIPLWLPQREQKSSLNWQRKPKDGARSGGTCCTSGISSFTRDKEEVSVISEGNGCCLSQSRGQKKQFKGLALGIVLFCVLPGEYLIKVLSFFVTLEAAKQSLQVAKGLGYLGLETESSSSLFHILCGTNRYRMIWSLSSWEDRET